MTLDLSLAVWIAIAVIAILLVVALVVGLIRYRRRRIRLSKADTATPIDRSGGYTASSGITFTQSSAATEAPPVRPKDRIDTSGIFTHHFGLDEVAAAYARVAERSADCVKVTLRP